MRRIKINDELEKCVLDYSKNIFSKRKISGKKKFQKPFENLECLKKELTSIDATKYQTNIRYIDKILNEYEAILKIHMDKVAEKKIEFDKILEEVKLNEKIPFTNSEKFYEQIVTAMRYDAVRDKEYYLFFKAYSLKSCVYCNAQLAVNITTNDGKNKSNFELDHFYPKSKYPFLCTSFYNLYPVCSNCNKAKSKNSVDFELYTKFDDVDIFSFELDKVKVASFLVDNDIDALLDEKYLSFNSVKDEYASLLKNHEETFDIVGIYSTQMDIVEELLHKAVVYKESYNKSLVNSFQQLFPDKALINRLVIGNYDRPEDIHKRPLAKFTQDIAEQLGLIPKK